MACGGADRAGRAPVRRWSQRNELTGSAASRVALTARAARAQMQVEGTALHEAAAWGRLEIAQLLLDAGADPNAYKEGGYRPLHYAAYNEHPDVVKLLLEYGADASLKDDIGNTPLAGRCNNNERIKDILACGAQGGGLEALD